MTEEMNEDVNLEEKLGMSWQATEWNEDKTEISIKLDFKYPDWISSE